MGQIWYKLKNRLIQHDRDAPRSNPYTPRNIGVAPMCNTYGNIGGTPRSNAYSIWSMVDSIMFNNTEIEFVTRVYRVGSLIG